MLFKTSHRTHARHLFFVGLLLLNLPLGRLWAQDESDRFKIGDPLIKEKTPATPTSTPFHFDQREWNRMRRALEEGEEPSVPRTAVQPSTSVAAPPKPPPGQIRVELPYESSLSITGRKVIKVDISNTHITKERADELRTKQDTQAFTMEQELQARIQGTVARKTTINVNYDDTKDNVRDFSVVYKGDPDEVVQEAAFGDIVLSLPSTEFVNYNKQLFGIRAALKYKRAGLMFIGSRTKGTTETKRFTGTTTRTQSFINDTNFVRRRFYDLTFATSTPGMNGVRSRILPIGNAPEDVYLEDTTGLLPQATFFAVATPTSPASAPLRIRMYRLSPGVDYSIDRIKGIISFVNPVPEPSRVAIDFALNDNSSRLANTVSNGQAVAVLIKDKLPEAPQVSQEIKRFYSVGARNIVRDNLLGNFILKLLDKNRENEVGTILNPRQVYPDTIEVNFETGVIELKNELRYTDGSHSNVYAPTSNPGSPVQSVLSVEYNSIQRTYSLRPNIVLQSEVVEVNGRRVTRDLDYFIDYDIGIITFFNPDLIREATVIEVTYEFAPFGGQLGETLVGSRATFDILQNSKLGPVQMEKWGAGSTVLYNFSAKPLGPPDIRSTPSSLLVTEGDSSVKGLKFGNLPFTTNLTAEKARSDQNQNIFGRALVDSMDGIKQEDAASLLKDSWQPAANPVAAGFNNIMDFRGREDASSHLQWREVDVPPFEDLGATANQKALQVTYQLNTSSAVSAEQVSMVSILSLGGRDFSKKTSLEVELGGAGSAGANVDVIIEYGTFNEDADGDTTLDTEDVIPFDGVLNLGEDVGYTFNGPGADLSKTTPPNVDTVIGALNTRLDTEDLNGDRVLNTQDTPAILSRPIFRLSDGHRDINNVQFTDLSFPTNERRLFKIPLNFNSLSAEEKARLSAVRQVRVTVRNNAPGAASRRGNFILARLSIVGNTWEPGTTGGGIGVSTMTVRAINNKDDASAYVPLFGHPDFNELYKGSIPGSDSKEQALSLEYDLRPGATGTTKNVFSIPRDLGKHDTLKFFLSKANSCAGPCGQFFFQAGSETQYQQAAIDIENIPTRSWMVVVIEQEDVNKDGIPDTWVSQTPGVTVTRVGTATNLTQVAQFKAGINNNTSGGIVNQVWLNEIHQINPREREGNAERYAFDTTWRGWMDFGGSFRDVDRNWQTPTTAVTNQDRTQSNGYMNFNRLNFLPMTYKTNREKTVTPSAFRANPNALVSFLQEGFVERESHASTAKLIIPKLPIFDFAYDNDKTEANLTQRIETNDTWRAGASYAPTVTWDVLPGSFFTFRPIPNSVTLSHSEKVTKLDYSDRVKLIDFGISTAPFVSTDLTQFSEENEARLTFKPWDGFTFNPAYRLRVDKERRMFRDDERQTLPSLNALDGQITPRSMAQTVSAAGNLRLLKWLDPRYTYSFTGSESNGIPTQSNTTNYMLKTITRNSQAEVSAATQVQQILPSVRLVQSMNLNNSYRLENGDTYTNMPEGFSWRSKLWVGQSLISASTSSFARRTDFSDRRTFRSNMSWQPLSAYRLERPRLRPFSTLSLTANFLNSKEETETTGTNRLVNSRTWPDLIVTMNDVEDLFTNQTFIDNSRLVLKTNTRKTETQNINKSVSDTYETEYNFQLRKKMDVAAAVRINRSQDDNLVTKNINSKSDFLSYSLQVRIPWRSWAFTPRYERSKTDARDSIRTTNDLLNEIYSLQIYGDITKPIGIRFGRTEIGLANRFILNANIKWDKKRSSVNPATSYLDLYSATMSGDYTISQNFRMALGGNFSQEVHHPSFKKLDRTTFGLNATLTIQF